MKFWALFLSGFISIFQRLVALSVLFVSCSALALTPTQVAKLLADDGAAYDQFGASVAVDGDTAVIGAEFDDDNGDNFGSAYVFTRSGSSWTQQAKLTASDGAELDSFGASVAVDGDTAVIGARYDDDNGDNSGSAYVFTRSGSSWTQQAKLTASDAAAFDFFGESVAVDGDTALIGADADDDNGRESGSAYVFTRSGSSWTQQAKLTASDAASRDLFGISVAVDGDTAVIGAYSDDASGPYSGSAYVFTRSGSSWTQQAKLTASDGASFDAFGISVAVDGDTAVIGARSDSDNGQSSGSAYVFTRSGSSWTQQAKLTASDAAAFDWFGISVAVDDDTAVIGAEVISLDAGSAYVFTRSGSSWTQQAKLTASDAAASDHFGISVAFDGQTAVIGAYLDDDNGNASGSAYVYAFGPRIDIKPGNDKNCFKQNGHGKISVAVLGYATFDPANIDISTLDFSGLSVAVKGNGQVQCKIDDVDTDGFWDLVCKFADSTNWNGGPTEATLTGELYDGTEFQGSGAICIK